jgi:hypothetical protein
VQLIVFLESSEQFRILLEEWKEVVVVVGRQESSGCVGIQMGLHPNTRRATGCRHLKFINHRGSGVVVEDLGYRDGSLLRSTVGGNGKPMVRGMARTIPASDVVALPLGMTIELPGRSIPLHGMRPNGGNRETDGIGRSAGLLTRKL